MLVEYKYQLEFEDAFWISDELSFDKVRNRLVLSASAKAASEGNNGLPHAALSKWRRYFRIQSTDQWKYNMIDVFVI